MDYQSLETFLTVCETKNLTTASEILFKAQPTITNRIKILEEYLGFSLFIRGKGKKSVSITSRGLEFLTLAQELMELYSDIEELKSDIYNTLNISSVASYATPIAANICKQMIELHDTNVKLTTYQTREAYEMISKKELDIALVSRSIPTNGVKIEPLFQQNYYIIKSSSQTLDNKKSVLPIYSNELDCNYEIYQNWDENFDKWHQLKFPKSQPKITVDSTLLLMEFIQDSPYWSIVQECNLPLLLKSMKLDIFKLMDPPPQRNCFMITNMYPDRELITNIKRFENLLKNYIENNSSAFKPYFNG